MRFVPMIGRALRRRPSSKQLLEDQAELMLARDAIQKVLGYGTDDSPDGPWPCGTNYYDALGPYVDKLHAEIGRLKDELTSAQQGEAELDGFIDNIDRTVVDALASIGRFPPKPAGFPDRIDVLCKLVIDAYSTTQD